MGITCRWVLLLWVFVLWYTCLCWLPRLPYRYCGTLCWSNCGWTVCTLCMIMFITPVLIFNPPFMFATWCFTLRPNWLIATGASSAFIPFSFIYRDTKGKKEDVTKTTVDTFALHTGLGWMEKKAYNYVSSLTVTQLPDYRDGKCTCSVNTSKQRQLWSRVCSM